MSLSKSQLIVSQKDVFSASVAIQTYVAAILRQPDIKLTELPELPKFQKAARQHAQDWLDRVLPAIINTNADIIDFANQFDSFYGTLRKLAEQIDAGQKSGAKKFAEGLVLLRNTVSRKEANANYTDTQLQDFKSKISVDHDNFNKQATAATKALTGANGDLQRISSRIDIINSKLNDYIGAMAGGGVALVGGIILILVGSFATIATEGVASGLIVGGVGLLVTGIGAEVTGGVEYALALEQKKQLQETLATDRQGIGIIKHVQSLLDGFVAQTDSATRSVGVLRGQWRLLSHDLNKVIADLDSNPGSLKLVGILEKAKGDWETALDLAKRMQPRGVMPVKAVGNMMDVIHTNQKPQRAP